jgi:hypothetical protein
MSRYAFRRMGRLCRCFHDFIAFCYDTINFFVVVVVVLRFVSAAPQAKFPEISYADLYTLAGVVAVEEAG